MSRAGAIAGGDLEAALIDVGRQILRLQIPGARDLAQRDAGAATDHAAVFDAHVGGIGLQQPCTDPGGALGQRA